MSQKLEMPRNQLIDETIHNVGRLYRIAVPFFLDLEAQASIAASEQGYAPIRLQTRNQGKVQAAHYQHETKYRFASTPDIGSLGIHSFPQYWEADSFWGLNYQEVFEKLPHASLTMITKLIGPNEGPYNQVVRQSAITLSTVPIITNVVTKEDDDDDELVQVNYTYSLALGSLRLDELTAGYHSVVSKWKDPASADGILLPTNTNNYCNFKKPSSQHPHDFLLPNFEIPSGLKGVLPYLVIKMLTGDYQPEIGSTASLQYTSPEFDGNYLKQLADKFAI